MFKLESTIREWPTGLPRAYRSAGMRPYHELVSHLENLLKVGGHGLGLVSETAVGADAHAVLAGHGQDGRAVVLQDRLSNVHRKRAVVSCNRRGSDSSSSSTEMIRWESKSTERRGEVSVTYCVH